VYIAAERRANDLQSPQKCYYPPMDTVVKISAVALGGALGAVARYLVNISPLATVFEKFPFPTFVINIVGSFLIGFVVTVFSGRVDVSENVTLALIVGFIGAFTTFSTFEMEMFTLVREGAFATAFLYVFLSVLTGFGAVVAGVALGRSI
jgi:CrcB protein